MAQIIPIIRVKRGILNPLGSLIKVISGNLDNEDALKYDRLISEVKSSQEATTKRFTLISKIVDSFINITNSSRNNFIQLDKEIWEIRKHFNQTKYNETKEKLFKTYNLFMHNFLLIYVKLEEIEDAVASSKLGTLHQSIIDKDELYKILKSVELKEKLIYAVTYENLLKIELSLELKVYSKGSKITFLLDVPITRKEVYNYYKILPLPTINSHNQTTLIVPEHPFILVKGSKTEPVDKPCKEIDEDFFLCQEEEILTLKPDKCVAELMKFVTHTNFCQPNLADIRELKIEPLQRNQWLIFTATPVMLKNLCETEIIQQSIRGTYILTMDDNCEVQILDVTLRRHLTRGEEIVVPKLPIINLPEIVTLQPLPERRALTLDGIDLADLQILQYELKRSDREIIEKCSESVINVRGISAGTLGLYVILLLGIVYILYFKIKKHFHVQNPQAANHPPDDFELREGGVMHPGPRVITVQR